MPGMREFFEFVHHFFYEEHVQQASAKSIENLADHEFCVRKRDRERSGERKFLPVDRARAGNVERIAEVEVERPADRMEHDVRALVAEISQDAGEVLIGVFALQDARYGEQVGRRRQLASERRRQGRARIRRVGEGVFEYEGIAELGAKKRGRVPFVAVGRDIARVDAIGRDQEDVRKPARYGPDRILARERLYYASA